MRGTLRPYQVRGYSWLAFLRRWGLGACLADDMGLGKTIQTLALLQHDRETATADGPPCCWSARPRSSATGSRRRRASRRELPVLIHHGAGGPKASRRFARKPPPRRWSSPATRCCTATRRRCKTVPWAGVILDEAQNIKNPETKQAQAARALKADYRIALTGTPVENHVGDLWSIMEFLNPGLLGTQADFKRNFFVPIQTRRDEDAIARLKRLTGPFILRRLKTDRTIIADLPDKLEMKVFCTLTQEQATLYAAVVEELLDGAGAGRGHPAQGHDPGDADEAQAGLQPPGPVPRRQLRDRRAAPASWPG